MYKPFFGHYHTSCSDGHRPGDGLIIWTEGGDSIISQEPSGTIIIFASVSVQFQQRGNYREVHQISSGSKSRGKQQETSWSLSTDPLLVTFTLSVSSSSVSVAKSFSLAWTHQQVWKWKRDVLDMGSQNIFKYLLIQRFFGALLRSGWALWIWMPSSVIACETFYFCRDIQILFGPSIHIWYLMKCEKLRNKVMNLKWSKGRYFFWLCPSRVDRSKRLFLSRPVQGCIQIHHHPRCPVLLSNTGKYPDFE